MQSSSVLSIRAFFCICCYFLFFFCSPNFLSGNFLIHSNWWQFWKNSWQSFFKWGVNFRFLALKRMSICNLSSLNSPYSHRLQYALFTPKIVRSMLVPGFHDRQPTFLFLLLGRSSVISFELSCVNLCKPCTKACNCKCSDGVCTITKCEVRRGKK